MANSTTQSHPNLAGRLLAVLGMALLGIGMAFGLLLLALWLFPGLLLDDNPDYHRPYASTSLAVEFRVSDGNMYDALPGSVRPLEEDTVLAAFTLAWDEDGFRVPRRAVETYPIAAFGDSFTEGFNVADPWPDVLDRLLDLPTRNYGYRGYGPIEVERAVREFGLSQPRRWIIYAYFSGNDLGDAVRLVQRDNS